MIAQPSKLENINRALKDLRQALEEFEGALREFEEDLREEEAQPHRPQVQGENDPELLTVEELSQELGMGKSRTYGRLRSG